MEPSAERKGRKRWSEQEDQLLRMLVGNGDGAKKKWREVAAHLPGRTDTQCQHRWAKVLRPDLKRGPWTPEEDMKLRQLVAQQGGVQHVKWTEIASHLPGRLGKQCRERYINACDPSIRRDAWTAEEDAIVREAYLTLGSRWKKIAALLQGRTENAIKNRFHSSAFRELREQLQHGAAPAKAAPADDGKKAKRKDNKKQATKPKPASAAPLMSAAAPSSSSSSSSHTPLARDAATSPGPTSSASPTPPSRPPSACAAEAVVAPVPATEAAATAPATTDFTAAAASDAMSAFTAESLLPTMVPASPWSPRDMVYASSFSSSFATSAATSLSASTGSLLFEYHKTATAGPTAAGEPSIAAVEACLPQPAANRHELPADHDLAQWQGLPSLHPVAEADPATFLLI